MWIAVWRWRIDQTKFLLRDSSETPFWSRLIVSPSFSSVHCDEFNWWHFSGCEIFDQWWGRETCSTHWTGGSRKAEVRYSIVATGYNNLIFRREIPYKAGDVIGVFAPNSPSLVDDILVRLKFDARQYFSNTPNQCTETTLWSSFDVIIVFIFFISHSPFLCSFQHYHSPYNRFFFFLSLTAILSCSCSECFPSSVWMHSARCLPLLLWH